MEKLIIQKGFFLLPEDKIKKNKKITGKDFISLIGMNEKVPIGDAILIMHDIVKPHRNIAEEYKDKLAKNIIKTVYERDNKVVSYEEEGKNIDRFSHLDNFGGNLHFGLPYKNELLFVYANSCSNYNSIDHFPPIENMYEALFYAFLCRQNKVLVEWVLFDEESEKEIMQGKKPSTLKNIKKITKEFNVDEDIMADLLDKALTIYEKIINAKKIPLTGLSDKIYQLFDIDVSNKLVSEEDLPF